ncbi:glycosyltransferase family 4 protein, partial [Rodentibacter mrazii]|uniref:glycosyltransferase family 4 protein n=1 Tax=Rodentibacter mrazii TaxID=1908257 RepID=UPI00117A30CF
MKRILFFTYGDANEPATWSNVPYLFSRTLENKGDDVVRVNIAPNKYINAFFRKVFLKVLSLFYPDHKYSFIRTPIYRFWANRVIQKAIKKHQPDLCLFTNFDFIKPNKNITTVLFSDWSYDILIRERLSREPYFFEKPFILHQEKAINSVDLVISLFEKCAENMAKTYPGANIGFLGGNVVNSLYDQRVVPLELAMKKQISNKILFIGGKHYKNGAQTLINAFNMLNDFQYELHIIGLSKSELENCSDRIYCYG